MLSKIVSLIKKILPWRIISNKYFLLAATLFVTIIASHSLSNDAQKKYQFLLSYVIHDRNNTPLSIQENDKGHYVSELKNWPDDFANLLVLKEDRFFYYHPGVNMVSTIRALYTILTTGDAGGSSTLTQQLAKNLLQTESDRNVVNKIVEAAYAVSLEIFLSKEEIFRMYINTAYLGNQVQGFGTASYAYFNKPLSETTFSEQISLLATLSYPSTRNPWGEENDLYSQKLAKKISPDSIYTEPYVTDRYSFQSDSYFEMKTAGINCRTSCQITIDDSVTTEIRAILNRHIEDGLKRDVKNGAVVVIDAHNLELLAMVGSRNPNKDIDGSKINMAIQPRPIGSTIKPFLYAKGFLEGLRPYTLVDDREYKYPIATGFSLYPKNYDGQYRGEITLHEALSNSLNVPTVKVLEYIGLDNFYSFMSNSLKFTPLQDWDSYQYGIALGGLEMDLATLTHYFTLFPNKGMISPLKIMTDSDKNFNLPPQSQITKSEEIFPPAYAELVHAVISDRLTGVNQFGLEGNLNLTTENYGVKTGTSRDFHDSWVVGYTPDFVVGVWLGNSENKPLKQVSGSSGAGAVWHDVMEYLLSTKYNQHSDFKLNNLNRFNLGNNLEWGLPQDVIRDHQNLLQENNLILSIHPGDTFIRRQGLVIPLRARKEVTWSINGQVLTTAHETSFAPTEDKKYEVSAYDPINNQREIIQIQITTQE